MTTAQRRGRADRGRSRLAGALMSEASIYFAGVVLVTVPTIAFGGARLLRMIWASEPGYLDNPVRQSLWRAGHAHAGVLVVLALVASLLVDHADLTSDARQIVRVGFAAPPILMPLGFFLSVALPLFLFVVLSAFRWTARCSSSAASARHSTAA